MAVRGIAARYPAPAPSPPTARVAPARWQPPGGRSLSFTVSLRMYTAATVTIAITIARGRMTAGSAGGGGERRRRLRRRRWQRQWRPPCGRSICGRRPTIRRAQQHLRASQRPGSAPERGRIGRIWHEFEPRGRVHTFSDAPEWPCHRPWGRWQGRGRPPTQKRRSRLLPLSRSSPEPRGQRAPGQAYDRYSSWAEPWRIKEVRSFVRSTSMFRTSF